jgi:hypothetical protein
MRKVDVLIAVGGEEGTRQFAEIAEALDKPIAPIEAFGNKTKTRAELDAAIAAAMAQVTASDARGWFKHCGYAPKPAA